MSLFYLYDEPQGIAQALADRHVVSSPFAIAQVLATAWWLLHSDWSLEMDNEALPGVFELAVPPAQGRSTGLPMFKGAKDGAYITGHSPFWLFCGQRIPTPREPQHPNVLWAQQRGGNYRWLHTLGMRILDEHKYRFGRFPKDARYLWSLELLPPALVATEDGYEELPFTIVPPKFEQPEDATTLEAWRRYYTSQGRLEYTKRQRPEWLKCTRL